MAKKGDSSKEARYHIPPDSQVIEAIKRVMVDRGIVHSQGMLKKLVERELSLVDPAYHVSEQRVRVLAIQKGIANVEIHFRESDNKANVYKCPVCEGKLRMVHNKTIFGGTVTLVKECTVCQYWVGIKHHVPNWYVFTLSPEYAKGLDKDGKTVGKTGGIAGPKKRTKGTKKKPSKKASKRTPKKKTRSSKKKPSKGKNK